MPRTPRPIGRVPEKARLTRDVAGAHPSDAVVGRVGGAPEVL